MELELKLALPLQDAHLLHRQLARCALIGRRQPQRQQLHNTYYDTPEHALKDRAVALRVRQIGDASQPHWVQTLKVGAAADSAFSRRGEWEQAIASEALSSAMLEQTPWSELDADGTLYAALEPVFSTDFERLSWIVKLADSSVEVALDRGQVHMDGHSTPLCELEIELLEGSPEALFDIAAQIGRHISLLPLHMSKAERAYRLAAGTLDAPLRARPPALSKDMQLGAVAQAVLRESFLQFTANLVTFRSSDAPEVLHQARVGWRRFKSALQLFKQGSDTDGMPSTASLKPLLAGMTAMRDLDVAATEVLPAHGAAYQADDAQRIAQWHQLETALDHARQEQRAGLRLTLAEPSVGQTLLEITCWLETGQIALHHGQEGKRQDRRWLCERVEHLVELVRDIPASSKDPLEQHRLRIVSKRLRYCVESLRPLLPRKRSQHWLDMAMQAQTQIGMERDRLQAIAIARQLQAPDAVVQFLRGAAFAALSAWH